MVTIEDVEKAFNEVYLLADPGVVRIVLATVISNRLTFSDHPVWLLLLAPSSGGKCIDGETNVLCYDGSLKKAKDIKVGDLLMGDDSTPRKVLSTTNGLDTMYKIKQQTGEDYIVNSPHILTLKYTQARTEFKGIKKGDIIDISLPDYLKMSPYQRSKLKGYKVGVEFKEKLISINPYFLGLWLGDGHKGSTSISKPDKEIGNFIRSYSKQLGLQYSSYKDLRNKCIRHSIIGPKGKTNPLSSLLDEVGLLNTTRRFIPTEYKTNTREIRLQLLAGLLDTDGFLDRKRGRFEFTNKSRQLVADVQFVARSLGLKSNKIEKTAKGIKSTGFKGTYYRIQITGNTSIIPTKIPRKQAETRTYKHDVLATSIKVQKLGQGRYYGFELDGNGRFLLGDFTVTHNTAILKSLDKLGSWIVPVDTLTTNTFASGFRAAENVSLLDKANGGVIVFKDFTTLTSMNKEGLDEIMGQMRSIYDGSFNKKTGSGVEVNWKGKIGIIAGGTVAVQRVLRQYSQQGERFIDYIIKQPDRVEMTKRAIRNQKDMRKKEEHLQNIVGDFVNETMERAFDLDIAISEQLENDMIEVANFATLARSPVILNKQSGKLEWVPDAEMPSRVATKFTNLAMALGLMHQDGLLQKLDHDIVYKTAFDSIPAERRLVLQLLTKWKHATTKSLAISLDYPTETVRGWCVQLNALKMVERDAGNGNSDGWSLKYNFRETMAKFEGIEMEMEELPVSKEAEERFDEIEHNGKSDDELIGEMDFGAFNN